MTQLLRQYLTPTLTSTNTEVPPTATETPTNTPDAANGYRHI
ncbi:MAG: hypothetical protein U0528_12585 [Anaerolineae bacterium]